jgi:predicted RNase H-like HicB family nuclease
MAMRYTVILEQDEDGGYVASVPALTGCVSQGDSRAEALANIREAIKVYLDDCIASPEPVPSEAGRGWDKRSQSRGCCQGLGSGG